MFGLFLPLIGLIAIVIFATQVYKASKDSGRSELSWTMLTIGIGLALQYLVPIVIGFMIGIYIAIAGPNSVETVNPFGIFFIIEIVCLILSFIGMLAVLKHVSSIPEDAELVDGPPPPSQFGV